MCSAPPEATDTGHIVETTPSCLQAPPETMLKRPPPEAPPPTMETLINEPPSEPPSAATNNWAVQVQANEAGATSTPGCREHIDGPNTSYCYIWTGRNTESDKYYVGLEGRHDADRGTYDDAKYGQPPSQHHNANTDSTTQE
jgi:hypothetical protein